MYKLNWKTEDSAGAMIFEVGQWYYFSTSERTLVSKESIGRIAAHYLECEDWISFEVEHV